MMSRGDIRIVVRSTGSPQAVMAEERWYGQGLLVRGLTSRPRSMPDAGLMVSPLVATKLSVPRLRKGLVGRPVLSARLRQGAEARLTLISAPAGFGKTTLLAEWLAGRPGKRAVAWLSLDPSDNDAATFWIHVIAALEKAAAGLGAALGPIPSPQEQPIDLVLAAMVNALDAFTGTMDLVLDDYQFIEQAEIQSGMQFLLEHLPPHVHLVIATRADPALPVAKLRARGELMEIRAADLRFTAEEAASYLNDTMGLGLSAGNIAALEARTEGWVAALQLAALSMQGRTDLNAFIAGFAGHDRYVFDYLVEEVLERQPAEVRSFLLRTCFLERLSGPLCDAVTGGTGSSDMLNGLYRANLFLVPLDDRREWYRYHHLFADVLETQMDDAVRRELPMLHRRASDWYEARGERAEAIRHALVGGDADRAAALIELAVPQLRRERREAALGHWIKALPDAVVRARPVLGVSYVGALVSTGAFEGLAGRLDDAERGLAMLGAADAGAGGIVVADREQLPGLPAQIALYRTALAQIAGDMAGAIAHAQRAFDLAPPDDHFGRAGAAGFLGIAFWSKGDLEAARRFWTECANGLQRAGHLPDVLGVTRALADILVTEGRLGEAIRACEAALQLPDGGLALRGSADMHERLSALYHERNDLQRAREHLSRSQELGELAGFPQHPHRLRLAMAQQRQDESDFDAALELLGEVERRYASEFFPDVRPIAAIRARVWIAQGRLDEALRWAKEKGVTSSDELGYLREFEHITLARLLLAQQVRGVAGAGAEAIVLLDRLLAAAEAGGRVRSVIEIEMLRALAQQQSDSAAALTALQRALALAEPEAFVRLFVEEGQPMEALLKLAVKRRIAPGFARKLLAAFGRMVEKPQTHPDLIEPLSERELDVLRLLRTDLGGPEIARELAVSLNTVRTHTKAIYEKLGANNRRAAVRRAEALDLLRGERR
jgi:LuxR family maltose regulon positive regulatory protein